MDFLRGFKHLLGGAAQTAGNVVHGAEQAVGNLIHPQQQQPMNSGRGPEGMPPPGTYRTDGLPNLNDPKQNPTSVGRVWGTLAANNAADQQGFTPFFKQLVMGAKPFVGQGSSGLSNSSAGGDYVPHPINQIELRSNQLDPYTITHEGLHAAYDTKTPQAQADFKSMAQKGLGKGPRFGIGQQLQTPLYGNTQGVSDINALPQQYATEVHSYAPEMGAVNSPEMNAYYSRYFKNPDFWQESAARHLVSQLLFPQRQPQFSDWGDN